MRRVCIICEGLTEANFILECLAPHLLNQGVMAYPSILQAPSGRHKGGRVTIERLIKHISHEYNACDRVTTLVDFYGFKDRDGRNRAEVEAAILAGVADHITGFDARFVLPYLQMHEFEGLLFSDIEKFRWVLDGWSDDVRSQLRTVREAFVSPEDINDSPETAPSKRILSIFADGSYSKTEHGPLIAKEIGLEEIRKQCSAFNEWVGALEAWGK
jgi:hypothetical protein